MTGFDNKNLVKSELDDSKEDDKNTKKDSK